MKSDVADHVWREKCDIQTLEWRQNYREQYWKIRLLNESLNILGRNNLFCGGSNIEMNTMIAFNKDIKLKTQKLHRIIQKILRSDLIEEADSNVTRINWCKISFSIDNRIRKIDIHGVNKGFNFKFPGHRLQQASKKKAKGYKKCDYNNQD